MQDSSTHLLWCLHSSHALFSAKVLEYLHLQNDVVRPPGGLPVPIVSREHSMHSMVVLSLTRKG